VRAEELDEGTGVAPQRAHMQRHVAVLAQHDAPGSAARELDPRQEVLRLAQGSGEGHELHRGRQVHERLFPHGAALDVVDVVDLVGDHAAEIIELHVVHGLVPAEGQGQG